MIISDYSWLAIHLMWILGWLLYKGFLTRSKDFVFNRFALYGILFFPFVLKFNGFFDQEIIQLSPLPDLTVFSSTIEQKSAEIVGWNTDFIHVLIYLIVPMLLLIKLVFELVQIYFLKRKSRLVKADFGAYYEMDGKGAFCFFKWIFIGEDQEDKALAYKHESIHANAWHSIDILLIRLFSVVFWLNPFWKKMEIGFKQNHEYYVDRKVLNGVNLKQYVASIVKEGLPDLNFSTISGLYQFSLIKNRIEMMKRKESFSFWRNVSFILVLFSGLSIVSCQLDSQTDNNAVVNFADLDEAPKVSLSDCSGGSMECSQKYIYTHIAENFSYPKDAKEKGITGKTFIQFIISETAEIMDVQVVKGSGNASLDEEALRLVNGIPNFLEAARKDGKHVATKYTVPILFKLN